MNQKMTWEEMKKEFPDEWLLITDFELDKYGEVHSGIIQRHAKSKSEVYHLPRLNKPVAFEYTGESTFNGLRSHAEHHCL